MTSPGELSEKLNSLFASIDNKDTQSFLSFLANDAVFRFGSAPPVNGHAGIRGAVDSFFTTIAGSRHHVVRQIHHGSTIVCEGEVTYRRHDDSELTVPFTNVFELSDNLISQYKIYIDIGPLYAT